MAEGIKRCHNCAHKRLQFTYRTQENYSCNITSQILSHTPDQIFSLLDAKQLYLLWGDIVTFYKLLAITNIIS